MNLIKTGMLFFVLTGMLLGAGYLLGGQQGVLVALVMAGVMNFIGYFFSDKIALMSMGARQVGPDHWLHQMVARLAGRANLPMPRVYISPMEAPNAFATGPSPRRAAVCATEGLRRAREEDEIAGVMAHELAHVRHRDILISTVAATIAGALTYLGYMFAFGGRDQDGDSNPVAGLLLLILGPIAAGILQAAISRQREYAADSGGAAIVGGPEALARALQKLDAYARGIPMPVNPAYNGLFIVQPLNAMRGVANLFSTHPPLAKRLENLLAGRVAGRHGYRFAA
jgi:heat shock protein HtpX